MYFERIYDDDLAAASYLIGCQGSGAVLVIDPLRDIDRYIDRAEELDFDITGVVETHIHADFLSGGRDLAHATEATLYVSGEAPDDWRYEGLEELDVRRLADHDVFEVGNVRLEALHTPGHTPEHMSYLVFDGARSNDPLLLLSGDFAFVGDLGRPDLLEKAADEEGTAREAAEDQFESVKRTLMTLPPEVQIWPAHGAGSACGKSLGAVPSSTVGYERKNAWWASYVEADDKDGFVEELLAGQPESPRYFGTMKVLNRDGMPLRDSIPSLPRLTPAGARRALKKGAIVVDTRSRSAFAEFHAAGSIHLPSLSSLSTHAGAVLPYDQRLLLVATADTVDTVRRKLDRVGVTQLAGWVDTPEMFDELTSRDELPPAEARRRIEEGAVPLDVRSSAEYDEGHLPGAVHIHYGSIADGVTPFSKNATYVVYCGSGRRAAVAVSLLARKGYDVVNGGGYAELVAG